MDDDEIVVVILCLKDVLPSAMNLVTRVAQRDARSTLADRPGVPGLMPERDPAGLLVDPIGPC